MEERSLQRTKTHLILKHCEYFFQNINILGALLTWEIGEACVSPFIPVSLVCYVCIRGDEMIFDIKILKNMKIQPLISVLRCCPISQKRLSH